MSRRAKRRDPRPHAADGSLLTVCVGCGRGAKGTAPFPSSWKQACPRCGTLVCRVCAEDQPHALSLDGSQMCELPPGVQPKTWGLQPYPYGDGNPFPPPPSKEGRQYHSKE